MSILRIDDDSEKWISKVRLVLDCDKAILRHQDIAGLNILSTGTCIHKKTGLFPDEGFILYSLMNDRALKFQMAGE